MKTCPYCAEEIQDAAIKCKHCGERLDSLTEPTAKRPVPPSSTQLQATVQSPTPIEIEAKTELVPIFQSGAVAGCGAILWASVAAFIGAQIDSAFVIPGLAIGGFGGFAVVKSHMQGQVTAYQSQCPYCAFDVTLEKSHVDNLTKSKSPIKCFRCLNFYVVVDGHLRRSTVGVAVLDSGK